MTRSALTRSIASRCGCQPDIAYYFAHRCFLRVISLVHIQSWFFEDGIEDNTLLVDIGVLMCQCLLDPNIDSRSKKEGLECKYNICLEGLDIIIEDYRKWHVRPLLRQLSKK